jgi:membrane protein
MSTNSPPTNYSPKDSAPIAAVAAETGGLPAPLQTLADRAPSLARVIQFGWRLGERWGVDKCPLMAAAMAFFGLLSLFPTLLAILAIMGRVLADRPELRLQLLGFVSTFLPPDISKSLIAGEVTKLASSNAVGIGVFSILSLLWSGRAFFDTLASVLNDIWIHTKPRTWLQQQIVLWSTLLGAGVLWILSSAASFGLTNLQQLTGRFGETHPAAWSVLGFGIGFLLSLGMFWTIYRFLPNAEHGRRGRVALIAAIVAAIGFEAAKYGYQHFLANSAHYGLVYGSTAGIVLTLMWLYISSSVILLGAEVAAAYEETRAAALGEAKPTMDKIEDEGAALPESGPAAASEVKEMRAREGRSKDQDLAR